MKIAILCFSFLHILSATKQQESLEARLERVAVQEGYGYKYGNLVILTEQVANIDKPFGYDIKVPEFVGIPSSIVQDLLRRNGFDIGHRWGQLIGEHFGERKHLGDERTFEVDPRETKMFEEKVLPADFVKDCAIFQQGLVKALEQAKSDKSLDMVKTFIEKHETKKLMVRSTGKEDSKELSNAGGNESVSNVSANFNDVYFAMGKVLESYFSEKSLLQRLRADDKSFLNPDQLTPILIQVMAGASDKETVTQCGVMFTEEPNMGAFTEGIQTTGISIIQSAYGHNESIVLGLVPFDTFYIDVSGNIYPIIRQKTDRMVPSAFSGELELIENGTHLIDSPSLTADAVRTLKVLAKHLENIYNGPMDVEFVVTDDPKEVLIVQARPIIKKVPSHPPSYLKSDSLNLEKIKKGKVILHGGSYVRECKEESTIVAKRILEAYNIWTHKPKGIMCIVLGDVAPETSHEATIFRSEGIAVIQIDEYNKVSEEIKTKNVLLSPQQELILEMEPSTNWSETVLTGWLSYPAPKSVSVLHSYNLPALTTFSLYKNRLDPKLRKLNVSNAMENLKNCNGDISDLSMNRYILAFTLLRKINEQLDRLESCQYANLNLFKRKIYELNTIFWKYTELVFNDCFQSDDFDTHSLTLTRYRVKQATANHLLHFHFASALINQRPSKGEVQVMSYQSLINLEIRPLISVMEKFKNTEIMRSDTIDLLQVAEYAYTTEVYNNFVKFTLKLDKQKDSAEYERFYQMVLNLFKIGVYPLWLQLTFAVALSDPQVVLNDYYQSVEFIEETLNLSRQFGSMSPQSFGKLKSFDKQIKIIEGFVEKFVSCDQNPNSFINVMKSERTTRLAKIIAVKVMSEFVELLDFSIKALKTSDEISKANLIPVLIKEQKMVALLYNLLKIWFIKLLPDPGEKAKRIQSETFPKIEKQVSRKDLVNEDYYFSRGFRVSSASLYSSSSLDRTSNVATLEDAYSLTHQNLQYVLGRLMVEYHASQVQLPEYLSKVIDMFEINQKQSTIIGVAMDLQNITIHANEVLINHGLLKTIVYNRKQPKSVRLQYWYAGLNNNDRWHSLFSGYAIYMFNSTFNIIGIDYDEKNGFGFEIVLDDNKERLEALKSLFTLTSEKTNRSYGLWPELNFFDLRYQIKNPGKYAQAMKYIAMKTGKLPSDGGFDDQLCQSAYEDDRNAMIELCETLMKKDQYLPNYSSIFMPLLTGEDALKNISRLSTKGDCFLAFAFNAKCCLEVQDLARHVLSQKLNEVLIADEKYNKEKYRVFIRAALITAKSTQADDILHLYTLIKRRHYDEIFSSSDDELFAQILSLHTAGYIKKCTLIEFSKTERLLYKELVMKDIIKIESCSDQILNSAELLTYMSSKENTYPSYFSDIHVHIPWKIFHNESNEEVCLKL